MRLRRGGCECRDRVHQNPIDGLRNRLAIAQFFARGQNTTVSVVTPMSCAKTPITMNAELFL